MAEISPSIEKEDSIEFGSSMRSFIQSRADNAQKEKLAKTNLSRVDIMINAQESQSRAELLPFSTKQKRPSSCTVINPLQKKRDEEAKMKAILNHQHRPNGTYGNNVSYNADSTLTFSQDTENLVDSSYLTSSNQLFCNNFPNQKSKSLTTRGSIDQSKLNSIIEKLPPAYDNRYKESLLKSRNSLAQKALKRGDLELYLDANKTMTFANSFKTDNIIIQGQRIPNLGTPIIKNEISELAMLSKFESDLDLVKKSFHAATAERITNEKEIQASFSTSLLNLEKEISTKLQKVEANLLAKISNIHNRIENLIIKLKTNESEINTLLESNLDMEKREIQELHPQILQLKAERVKELQKVSSILSTTKVDISNKIVESETNRTSELDVLKINLSVLEEKLEADVSTRLMKFRTDLKTVQDLINKESEEREANHDKLVTAIEEVFAVTMQDILVVKERREKELLMYHGLM